MTTRRQLTLFVDKIAAQSLEQIRRRYNPEQFALIPAHVTLCREDELADIERVMQNLSGLRAAPVALEFGSIKRFADGNGLLLPAIGECASFKSLRRTILEGIIETPRQQDPHITLIHPRNSTCTDEIFNELRMHELPRNLQFSFVSLIEQQDSEPWKVLGAFPLSERAVSDLAE